MTVGRVTVAFPRALPDSSKGWRASSARAPATASAASSTGVTAGKNPVLGRRARVASSSWARASWIPWITRSTAAGGDRGRANRLPGREPGSTGGAEGGRASYIWGMRWPDAETSTIRWIRAARVSGLRAACSQRRTFRR